MNPHDLSTAWALVIVGSGGALMCLALMVACLVVNQPTPSHSKEGNSAP